MEFNIIKLFAFLLLPILGLSLPFSGQNEIAPPVSLYLDNSLLSHVGQDNYLLRSVPIRGREGSNVEEEYETYRLPNETIPLEYDITLTTKIHEKNESFTGVNVIKIKVEKNTKEIVLHGRQIQINEAELTNLENGEKIDLEPITFPLLPAKPSEFLKFVTQKELKADTIVVLTLKYNGTLRHDNGGFYYSEYKFEDKYIPLATTQFESTDARHAFPCYDEPAKKANFTITIVHGENYTALSNTRELRPKSNDETVEGMKTTKFETSNKMSTYLVAFVISDFGSEMKLDEKRNLKHGVYSRKGTEDERAFPLEASIKILTEIENYVNYKYSFPKMDQISIPDFAAGAMENWGLVTYREEMLLYNDKRHTTRTKTVVANTVAHEYGHQWFGNLVSPQWWEYLWLNEGFASIFAYIGADKAYPDWDIMEHFIVAEYQRALSSDEGIRKRPMTYYVESPQAIPLLFDSVSYSKAACVINMMRHYVGEETFKKALNIYLQRMEYKSANETDLFEAFQTALKVDSIRSQIKFAELMESWSRTGGFPLLTVKRNYDDGSFEVTQSGFKALGETGEDKRKWNVPFNFVTAKDPNFDNTSSPYLMEKTKDKFEVKLEDDEKPGKEDWLILNKQLTGYYRVQYDDDNWDLIIKALKDEPEKIHKYNRAQLVFDSFRLAINKLLKTEKLFSLLEYLKKETEYSPWTSANQVFQFYKDRFHDNEEIYKNLQFFIDLSVEDIYKKVEFEKDDDKHFTPYIRSMVINWACIAGKEECLDKAHKYLEDLVENNTPVKPDLQTVVYCQGLKKATEKEFNAMFDKLFNSNDQAERQLIMSTLGCTHNEEFLKKFVEASIDMKNNLKDQERINILKYVYTKSKEGFKVVADFLIAHFKEYAKLKPGFGGTKPLDDDVKALSTVIVSEDQKNKMNEVVEAVKDHEHVDPKLKEWVDLNIKVSLDWNKENEGDIKSFLEDFKKRNGSAQTVVSFMALAAVLVVSIRNLF